MKYCPKCGNALDDDVTVCDRCGANQNYANENDNGRTSTISPNNRILFGQLGFAFMIVGTVTLGWLLFPLLWCIPMTMATYRAYKNNTELGIGFSVCALLFVSLIGGIFLLLREM